MSVREILEELPRLDVESRRAIFERLVEIDPALEADEPPEMLAAIDEGIRSLDVGEGIPIEEVRRLAQRTSSNPFAARARRSRSDRPARDRTRPAAASRLGQLLLDNAESLARLPERDGKVRRRPGVRKLVQAPYLISIVSMRRAISLS